MTSRRRHCRGKIINSSFAQTYPEAASEGPPENVHVHGKSGLRKCPGCGDHFAGNRPCCAVCWVRLPLDIRMACRSVGQSTMGSGQLVEHKKVVRQWFVENPEQEEE